MSRLIMETYSDVASPIHTWHDVIGWRCINCGEYLDRLVLLNRWAQQGVGLLQLQWVERGLSPRRASARSTGQQHAAA